MLTAAIQKEYAIQEKPWEKSNGRQKRSTMGKSFIIKLAYCFKLMAVSNC